MFTVTNARDDIARINERCKDAGLHVRFSIERACGCYALRVHTALTERGDIDHGRPYARTITRTNVRGVTLRSMVDRAAAHAFEHAVDKIIYR